MIKIPLFLILTIVVASCATSDRPKAQKAENLSKEQISQYNARVSEEKRIICRNEKPLGSNIAERKCYTSAELKQREADDKDMLRKNQSRLPGTRSE
jgi:hypothetical protein